MQGRNRRRTTRAGTAAGHVVALFAAAWLVATPALAQSPPAAAQAVDAPTAHRQASSGDEALDNAVAAVVVAALVEQMNTPSIEVNIDAFDVAISSVRDRNVSGQGRMRVGDDADWIGFRYSTVYDTTFNSAGYPRIAIGGVSAGEREVPNDATLVRQLEDRVATELDRQFGNRAARLQLDEITTVEGGKRLLRITARGIADLGLQGSTPVRIEALYDQVAGSWQRVNYELGAGARD